MTGFLETSSHFDLESRHSSKT